MCFVPHARRQQQQQQKRHVLGKGTAVRVAPYLGKAPSAQKKSKPTVVLSGVPEQTAARAGAAPAVNDALLRRRSSAPTTLGAMGRVGDLVGREGVDDARRPPGAIVRKCRADAHTCTDMHSSAHTCTSKHT